MKKLLFLAGAFLALAIPVSAFAGESVEDPTCVTVVDEEGYTIHHDAVTHEVTVIDVEAVAGFWTNFAPNHDQGPFEGPPSFPLDARGTWEGYHTEGGPGQDMSGVYQVGNGNGDWFYRQQAVAEVSHVETVVDVEAYDEVVPPVTHEECDNGGGNPPPPPPGGGDTPTPHPMPTPDAPKMVPTSKSLPFTGAPTWAYIALGLGLLTAGFGIRHAGRLS